MAGVPQDGGVDVVALPRLGLILVPFLALEKGAPEASVCLAFEASYNTLTTLAVGLGLANPLVLIPL